MRLRTSVLIFGLFNSQIKRAGVPDACNTEYTLTKHAVKARAGSLDYNPTFRLDKRATRHFKRAALFVWRKANRA